MAFSEMLQLLAADRAQREERDRAGQFNLLGALGGALIGGLMAPGQRVVNGNTVEVPWLQRLISSPAILGGISGATSPITGNWRDLVAGGLQGYAMGADYLKGQREEAKLALDEAKGKREELRLEKETGLKEREVAVKEAEAQLKAKTGIKSPTAPKEPAGKNMQWVITGVYPDGQFRWEVRSKGIAAILPNIDFSKLKLYEE
jgi:hypothetical protein